MDQDHFGWASFRALSPKKKLEHILYYYKWYILAGIGLLWLLIALITTIFGNQKESLISGIFLNVATSEDGYTYLEDGYWEACGSDSNTRAEVTTSRSLDFSTEVLSEDDSMSFIIVSSMIAARTLDYIITDESTLEGFWEQEVVLDLREILSEEELAGYDTIEIDGTIAAIRLSGSDFSEKYPLTGEDSCIFIVACTQDYEKDARFLHYVLEGTAEVS